MGCECASLRLEMSSQKSEILSQRSVMVQWFETLMAELEDVKKQNLELKELFKASNHNQQESIAVYEPSILERYSASGSLETNPESTRQFLEFQPVLSTLTSNPFITSVEVTPKLKAENLIEETGFQFTVNDQKNFPPEIEPSEDNHKSPLNSESTNIERFESPVDTMETSSVFTNEDAHKRIKSRRQKPVPFVREKTARRQGLNASKRNNSSTKKGGKFRCSDCSYRTSHLTDFKRHCLIHTGEKPFSCDLCDYRCRLSTNLIRHNLTHTGEKPFECDQCEYRASRKDCLISHLRTHSGEKPFACDLCDYRTAQKSTLVDHKKRKHKMK